MEINACLAISIEHNNSLLLSSTEFTHLGTKTNQHKKQSKQHLGACMFSVSYPQPNDYITKNIPNKEYKLILKTFKLIGFTGNCILILHLIHYFRNNWERRYLMAPSANWYHLGRFGISIVLANLLDYVFKTCTDWIFSVILAMEEYHWRPVQQSEPIVEWLVWVLE